ncbi:MAG: PIN domain-containing protein [Candidatus Peregrinibacteria bacterium]
MILVDTCVWISLIDENDTNHEKAIEIFSSFSISEVVILDQIYAEILTVLRYKVSEDTCKRFYYFIKRYSIPVLDSFNDLESGASLFLQYPKLSFVNALLVHWKKQKKYEVITFDKSLQKALEEE